MAFMRNCQVREGWGAAELLRTRSWASANHLGFCQMGVAENWEGKMSYFSKEQTKLGSGEYR